MSDEELMQLARQYVAVSPTEALAWAQSADDALLRERMLFAVLRAWGEKDPAAAVDWALLQDADHRFKRMEAALTGVVAQTSAALVIGRKFLNLDAESGNAYCTALVGALNRSGHFRTSFQLATEGPTDARQQWMETTLCQWAREQPQEALQAANSVDDDLMRPALRQSVVGGWASHDPASLAQYAISLPAGETRSRALDQATDAWLNRDPVGMGEWLNTLPASPETDAAAAKLIIRTDQANRSVPVALGWVEQIQDVGLRTSALAHVIDEWVQADPIGADQYLAEQSWLSATQRAAIIADAQRHDSDL